VAEEMAQKELKRTIDAHVESLQKLNEVDQKKTVELKQKREAEIIKQRQRTEQEFEQKAPIRRAAELKKYQDALAAEQEAIEQSQKTKA